MTERQHIPFPKIGAFHNVARDVRKSTEAASVVKIWKEELAAL